MADEIIDIYDANLNRLGAMERVAAHIQGKWHRTFHCWVVNGTGEGAVLFQMRSSNMVNFPNLLDVSAAGHLEAGEEPSQGIREVVEELGIEVSSESLYDLGYRVEVADQSNGQHNREYQSVHLLRHDHPLSSYRPQTEEIAGLGWLALPDALNLFSDSIESATVEGIAFASATEQWQPFQRVVTKGDFLPRIQKYYLTASIMAERLLQGRFPLSIS